MSYSPRNPNGQATMANSEPVVLASDQASIPVTVSGVSTAANQTTIIGHVDGIEGLLTTIDTDTSNISTKIDTLAGAVSGTEFQVDVLTMPTITVNSHAVTNAGTFVVQENGAALTSLQLLDDTVQVLGTDTYTEATSKGITLGAVRRDADTTLVNTTNEFTPLQVDANGRLKVEVFSGETLPVSLTSTTVTGTVAVTQSGTWDEVGINDSGNSITVDNGGTFAVQVDGSALTSLQLLDDVVATTASAITTKGYAISGTDGTNARIIKTDTSGELQVDVLTMPTITETNSANALTALQLIDDIVYTDDTSTHSTGSSKGALIMAAAAPTDTAVNANDIGAVGMTVNRELYVSLTTALPAGTAAIGKLAANDGVDIGDVTINNASGGSAVNIQDGGNSITVDGTIAFSNTTIATTNAGTFAVQDSQVLVDNAGFTDGTSKVFPIGYIYDEVAGTALTENDIAAARINVNRALVGTIEDGSTRGRYATVTASNALKVDASAVAVPVTDNSSSLSVDWNGTQPVTGSGTATGALRVELPTNGTGVIATVSSFGTGTTGPMKAEDVAHSTGDMGIPAWGVANEAQTATAADGDYMIQATDTKGNRLVVGNLAHDAVDAGFPIKIGGQARQTNITAVADADRVNAMFDDVGRIVTADQHVRDLVTQSVTTITSSTSETTILSAGAAGVFHDVKSIMIANKSASATLITIRDATAGSAVAYIHCPAGDTRGVVFNTPFKQTTAANNWTAQAGTSVDSLYITVQAVKNV